MSTNIFSNPTEINASFTVGGTDNLAVTSTGNVGIGTTSPTGKLHVATPDPATNFIAIDFRNPSYGIYGKSNSISGRGNTLEFTATDYNSGGTITTRELLTLRPEGNIGIGITNPTYKLHVSGSTRVSSDLSVGNIIDFDGNVTPSSINDKFSIGVSDTYAWIQSFGGRTLRINDLGNNVVFSNSTTKVGIGITDPTAVLHVSGGAGLSGLSVNDPDFMIGLSSSLNIAMDTNEIQARDNGVAAKLLLQKNGGNVGIANSDPDALLDVGISIHQSATGIDIAGGAGGANVIGLTSSLNHNWLPFTDGRNYLSAQAHTFRSADHTTDWMHIAPTGNVGIGTTSPNYKLDVAGEAQLGFINFEYSSNYAGVRWKDSGYNLRWKIGNDSISGNWLYLYDYAMSASAFTFKPNGDMMFTPGGNVGIGTTSPENKLSVSGDIGLTGNIVNYDRNDTTYPIIHINDIATASDTNGDVIVSGYYPIIFKTDLGHTRAKITREGDFQFYTGTGGSVGMHWDNSANGLGIGTTSPSYKLSVNGDAGIEGSENYLYFHSSATVGSNARARMRAVGAGGGSGYGGDLRIDTRASNNVWNENVLTVANTGNVGIGTDSPGNKLHIKDGASGFAGTFDSRYKSIVEASGEAYYATYVPDNSYSGIRFNNTSGLRGYIDYYHGTNGDALVYSSADNQRWLTGGTERIRLISNGYVGIGTTAPDEKLDVRGAISVGTGTDNNQGVFIKASNGTSGYGVIRFYHAGSNTGAIHSFSDTWQSGTLLTTSTNAINIDSADGVTFGAWNNIDVAFFKGGSNYFKNNVGIGNSSPSAKLDVTGSVRAGGKTTYTKYYAYIDTTGNAVAGLLTSGNGSSSMIIFEMYGGTGGYQRIVYSCYNGGGTWFPKKVIDEGTDILDVTSSGDGTTVTFTFKSKSGTQSYSPTVTIEHIGAALDTSYL